jgi:hypothetical protein
MKHIVLTLTLLILTACAVQNIPTSTTTQTSDERPSMTVAQFKLGDTQQASVDAFVVKVYTCPPCPAGAMCKPCMGDNIVISDDQKQMGTYTLTDNDIIVFTDKTKDFTTGKKYTFTIRLTDSKSTMDTINDVELVDYSPR